MTGGAPISDIRQRMAAAVARLARNEGGTMLFVFTFATLVLRFGSNIVLTHVLSPEAFGVIGVIISVMVVLTMLSDFGFAAFVIRSAQGGEKRFLDVIWTIRLGQTAAQSAVMAAAAWPIALFLAKPELAGPLAISAPLLFLNALTPMTLLLGQREGRVRATCAVELVTLAIQIGANLALSFVLPDYRALIVGLYVAAAVRPFLTLMLLPGGSRIAWDRGVAKEFFGYSRLIIASTILTLLLTQSDKLLFARLFTVADFGIYVLPANLALAAAPFGRNYVERYFFPLVSRAWREAPETLPGLFYTARARMFPLLFAGMGFGIGAAPLLFALLFDHRYEHGWIYLSVLMLRAVFELDSFTNTETILATGRTGPLLKANIIRLSIFVIVVSLGFRPLGPIALPLALAAAEAAALLYTIILLHGLGLFRLRTHLHYYVLVTGAAIAGAAISFAAVPAVVRAGLALIG